MPDFDPATHVVVHKNRRRWEVLTVLLLIGLAVGGAYYYRGQTLYVDGKAVVTVPDLTQRIQLKTPEGQTAEVQIQQPAPPSPNGSPPKVVVDGFGPDHRIQRSETDTNRYDPIDKLDGQIGDLKDTVKAGFVESARQITVLGGQISAVNTKVDGIDTRVAKLETVPATPAPTQLTPQSAAPAPQTDAQQAPAPAPQVVVPGPQVSASASAQVAANVSGVDPREVAAAAAAYKALGPKQGGGQIQGHRIVSSPAEFGTGQDDACSPGKKRVVVGKVDDGHYTHYRTECR